MESKFIDILGISESWLTEAIPDDLVRMKGYNLFRLDRQWNDRDNMGCSKRGGGLLCYACSSLNVSDALYDHLNSSSKDLEMQWLSVKIPNMRPLVILNVYRPPQGEYKTACKIINDSIAKANLKSNTEIYLMGDFNIDLLIKTSPAAKELLFTTGSNGLFPKVQEATRFSSRNGTPKKTCIDQIFTNSSLIVESKTLNLNISDHLAVYVRRKKVRTLIRKVSFTGRSYKNFIKEDFQEALIETDWEEFYASGDPNKCWDLMEGAIRINLDRTCPTRKFRVREIRDLWITDEILEEIKDKDIYVKTAKRSGKAEDWDIAKRERNRVGKLVKGAKADFVKEQQRELKGEPRKFWKLISTIVPGKRQTNGKINLADTNGNAGVSPEVWKRATVIPLFKSGDRAKTENYRPISLLPLPGKLIEKVAHSQISLFLEDNHILSDQQNGFRKGLSTVTVVADLTDDLFSAINNSEIALSVFIDLRKAFDTVSHDILCKKLEKYGVRTGVLNWCQNYLSNRSQCTLANGVRSTYSVIDFGVPQGSVLGPLFFILYVNDLQQALNGVKVQLYADDTVLYISHANPAVARACLQVNLNRLHKWCAVNKLTLNPSKTKMMSFGTRHSIKKAKNCRLVLDSKEIQVVSTFKYLGFTLDTTLNFKAHTADVLKKVIHKRMLLTKIISFLNKDVAILIYKLMILPYFDYCDVIYATACANDLDKIQRLQNKCLKSCLNLHKLCNTDLVHSLAKCAPLPNRRETHICNFMFKRLSKEHLVDERDIQTRRHDAPLFKVDFPNKEPFKRSVKYHGSNTWNNLPVATRSIDDYFAFKHSQKKILIQAIPSIS